MVFLPITMLCHTLMNPCPTLSYHFTLWKTPPPFPRSSDVLCGFFNHNIYSFSFFDCSAQTGINRHSSEVLSTVMINVQSTNYYSCGHIIIDTWSAGEYEMKLSHCPHACICSYLRVNHTETIIL